MAPEFRFEISTDNTKLSEDIQTRAAANRQSLADRQQAKNLEQQVNVQATRAQKAINTASAPGARLTRPGKKFDELIGFKRKKGIRVLNLFMGNGPVHELDTGDITVWFQRNWSFNNAYLEPGPENNLTYSNIQTIYNRALTAVNSELRAVYANKVTNVFLHIIGSQYMDAAVTTYDVELPEGTFSVYGWESGPTSVTDALPTNLTGISNIRKIVMRANTTDVVGHLRNNGINIDAYDCIFIQTGYATANPAFAPGNYSPRQYPFTFLYTIEAPRIHYNYQFRSLLTPVIFDSNGENEDPNSAPLANLLAQLDNNRTCVFNDEIDASTYMPNALAQDYTTENVETVMEGVKERRNRLISISTLTYPSVLWSVRRAVFLIAQAAGETPSGSPTILQFEAQMPFFSCLTQRLKYPITPHEVLTPEETYLLGVADFLAEYVPIPVETRERTQPLYENLQEAYSNYLYNACIATPSATGAVAGFTASLLYTYALNPAVPDQAKYYYPYLEYTVGTAMLSLYNAALSAKNLKGYTLPTRC